MNLENEETIDRIFNSQSPALIWFIENQNQETEKFKIFQEVAEEFKGKVAFVRSGFEGETESEFANYFDVADDTLIGVLPLTDEDVNKYLYVDEWTEEKMRKWIQDLLAGNLEKHLKSEEIPKKSKGVVQKIVGKNFVEVAEDVNTHVLVYIHAPWCEHCKKVTVNIFNFL